MDLTSDDLSYVREGAIATITLQRPAKLNTVTAAMGRQLFAIATEINGDDAVRVVVLQGTGERAFSAGSDVKVLDDYGTNFQLRNRPDYCTALWTIRKPVIASIRGYCIGGGLEMALSCDIRVASETARFGAGEIKLGWHGGAGNTQLLPRLVADADLEATTAALAERIAANAPIAAQLAKHLIRMSESTAVDVGLRWENDLFAYCFTTQDAVEGRAAFTEKRQPVFKGE